MCKISQILDENQRRNNLSKLTTFHPIFQLPHSALLAGCFHLRHLVFCKSLNLTLCQSLNCVTMTFFSNFQLPIVRHYSIHDLKSLVCLQGKKAGQQNLQRRRNLYIFQKCLQFAVCMDVAPWCYKWMDWMDGIGYLRAGVGIEHLTVLIIPFRISSLCLGRGSRQAEKSRREAELEVEAAGRKLEALEVIILILIIRAR